MSGLKKKLAFVSEMSVLSLLAIVAGTLSFVALAYFLFSTKQVPLQQACSVNSELSTMDISINDKSFKAEVAVTTAHKSKGLSDRECLSPDRAMLFVYEEPGNYCYWMKDMNFPIDMVWLDVDKKIINITTDVQPDSYPTSFCPERPAQYVVEVATGVAGANGWQPNDQFTF